MSMLSQSTRDTLTKRDTVHIEEEADDGEEHVKSLQELYREHVGQKKQYEKDQNAIMITIIALIVVVLILIGFPTPQPSS